MARVLLVLPSSTYRATEFLAAATPLGVNVVAGWDAPQAMAATLLGYRWSAEDPLLDELQTELAARTERAAETAEPVETTYAAVRALVFARLGRRDPGPPEPVATRGPEAARRPHLSEPWFCCAEPTRRQLAGVGGRR
jgi:hypothetical protein